jgi:ribosome recycling factor
MPQTEMKNLKQKMDKALEFFRSELLGVRTGRAHPALVEDIRVDYYGTPTPIKQLGTVNVPEARQIVITPWDKSAGKLIEKAIQASSLGINPNNDGENIRLNLPELNRERRIELTKLVRKYGEDAKIAVRNLRRDALEALKKMEKDSEITEDDLKRYQKEVQEMTDEYTKKLDVVLSEKEEEIMEQ